MAVDSALWLRKTKVTIDSAFVMGSVAGFCAVLTKHVFQTNAPEFLSSTNANRPKADGSDIRITTDEAGLHELPFEIEQYTQHATPSSAAVQIWTRVPNVSATADTEIWVWWGNTAASAYAAAATYGSRAVWVDYLMVCHGAARYVSTTHALDSTGSYSIGAWLQFGSPSAEVATANLPPFGVALRNTTYYGGFRSDCELNEFLEQMGFFVETFARVSSDPSGYLISAGTGGTSTDFGTDQGGSFGISFNDFGETFIYASILTSGAGVSNAQIQASGVAKFTEAETYTWFTLGRNAGFSRLYVGDGIVLVADTPTLFSTAGYATHALVNANHQLSEWRIAKFPPDESRHVTSRNMVRNLGTMIFAAVPQAGLYASFASITLTGMVSGSRFRLERTDTLALLGEGTATGSDAVIDYAGSGYNARLIVRKSSAPPRYLEVVRTLTLTASSQTVIVEQQRDLTAV